MAPVADPLIFPVVIELLKRSCNLRAIIDNGHVIGAFEGHNWKNAGQFAAGPAKKQRVLDAAA